MNKKDKRRIPTSKEFTKDRKVDAQVYSKLQIKSNWNSELKEEERYIYKNDFSFEMVAQELKMNPKVFGRKMKYLEKAKLIIKRQDAEGKTIYYLPKVFDYYILIEAELLRVLTNSTNSNTIKLYCIYRSFNDMYKKPCIVNQQNLCEMVGLSKRSEEIVKDINICLEALGLITIEKTYINDSNKTKCNLSVKTVPYKQSTIYAKLNKRQKK